MGIGIVAGFTVSGSQVHKVTWFIVSVQALKGIGKVTGSLCQYRLSGITYYNLNQI